MKDEVQQTWMQCGLTCHRLLDECSEEAAPLNNNGHIIHVNCIIRQDAKISLVASK